MKICEMCNVLFNMSLGLDYADGADSNKEELDILETEIKEIKDKDKSLYYVIESIAEQSKTKILKIFQSTATEVLQDEKNRFINCYK